MADLWVDVTQQLRALTQKLDFLQIVAKPSLDLEQTMHAHEINDPKIDPKWDISEDYTISKMMEKGEVRLPDTLTLKQTKNIFAEILKFEGLVLQGHPLHQTIYTFIYLYDQKLSNSTQIVHALTESIHSLGTYVYELHKNSCTLKEDDLSFSIFSFKNMVMSHDQISELLLKAEKEVQSTLKNLKDAQNQMEGKELIAHLKIRRAIHLTVKALGSDFQPKLESKILSEIKSLRKRIGELQTLIEKNNLKQEIPLGVFNVNVAKTLRSNFGMRTIKLFSLKQAFDQIKNFIDQIELFVPPPLKIEEYCNRLNILSYKQVNLLAKSYLKTNFFKKENHLMNTIRNQDAILNDMKEWMSISPQLKNHQKFQNLVSLSGPTLSDLLYKNLGRNTRWFWQISKVYDDFNVLIHLCNEIDGSLQEKKKECFVSSWYYNIATISMIRQILWGFQQDLYQTAQYHYVAYYLQYILHINQKNNNYLINNIDKSIIQSYYDGSLGKNKKKKKLLSDSQKRFLSNSLYLKGLHYYFRSFYRLLLILINRKLISDLFEEKLELRINNRFRIFKNVLFLKKLNYQTYQKEFQIVRSDQGKIIEQATDLLKAAKTIFSLFSQFQESQTYFRQIQEASILQKLSVKLSLVALTLKFKQNKQFLLKKEYKKFPQILIQ